MLRRSCRMGDFISESQDLAFVSCRARLEILMRVTIVGAGYVGLCTAVGLAKAGHFVDVFDVDEAKIRKLRDGQPPIFEEGLEQALKDLSPRLTYSTTLSLVKTQVLFLAVGTPQAEDGSANLSYLFAAANAVRDALPLSPNLLILTKSTVPVGTCARLRPIFGGISGVTVGSNPEFLREGMALHDVDNPDRIVVGLPAGGKTDVVLELYSKHKSKIYFMSPESAELTKYGANAMLATRISFMNELANLSERVGADIRDVQTGIGTDSRIGPAFLNAGPGYGGSCVIGSTKVFVFDGLNYKETPITHVKQGDQVLSWKIGSAQALPASVSAVSRRHYDGPLLTIRGIDETNRSFVVRATPDHPFVVRHGVRGWDTVSADRLRVGSCLPVDFVNWVGEADVTHISSKHFEGYVYSLEVPEARTFVVDGGVIIHNCFPKDVKALLSSGREVGVKLSVAEAADRANDEQKRLTFEKIVSHLGGSVAKKKIAILGLAFKPSTDDIRESVGVALTRRLLDVSAVVQCHDPNAGARENAISLFEKERLRVPVNGDAMQVVSEADAVVVVTDWPEYKNDVRLALAAKETAVIFDLRNCLGDVKNEIVRSLRKYVATGR